ncbi:amidohydrolase [Ramlibacter sp. AW1]|uniref:Amidohydrolase n=1 Tax=Ramlibacter aurantiacus TaxID=2801330 RepID=A0A937D6Z4_9BURK|nr:amidohydrolase family protein [Ramlibacter aurantiacus]MBL0421463.1 amidohydrolase [Ramlibacter aurantiacus]
MSDNSRIDVHHHTVPAFWADQLARYGGDPSGWGVPSMTVAQDLQAMDRHGIGKAYLSLTSPGISGWPTELQPGMARRVNEYTAEVKDRYPERFGFFATLPLATIESALAELAHAIDALGAGGVVLPSNADGIYLGEERFEPLWAELDRRATVVLIHPTMPPAAPIPGIPSPLIDYPFDTTRAALSMIDRGVFLRHARVKVILSHGGGFLPYVAYRVSGAIAARQRHRTPGSVIAEMKRFYYDTALASGAPTLRCLLDFAPAEHVLFGSDIPYAPEPSVAWFTRSLDSFEGIAPEQKRQIDTANALRLFAEVQA